MLSSDALSNEMFCYGDAHAADFTEIILRTIGALQYSSMIADLHSRGDDQLTVARILLNSLDLQRDRLAAPGIVLGFKISNTQRVQSQLKRLEALVKPHLDSDPRFQGSLKRTTIGGDEYLTMELDGKMVPWHDVPWDRLVEKPNQYDELRAKLMNLKLTITLGVRGDYLLFSLGGSNDQLAALGTGKLLADLPELKPIAKYAGERLVDISFVSKSMLQAVSNTNRDLDELVNVVRRVLPQAGLPDELNQRIAKDAEELAGDVKTMVPKLGSHASFSFLTRAESRDSLTTGRRICIPISPNRSTCWSTWGAIPFWPWSAAPNIRRNSTKRCANGSRRASAISKIWLCRILTLSNDSSI